MSELNYIELEKEVKELLNQVQIKLQNVPSLNSDDIEDLYYSEEVDTEAGEMGVPTENQSKAYVCAVKSICDRLIDSGDAVSAISDMYYSSNCW